MNTLLHDDRLPERFWSKITVDPITRCWLWTAALTSRGYGSWSDGVKVRSTHRVTFEAFNGPIPDGLTVDHLCLVKRCCNPAHLEAVTQAENARRWLAGLTHCKYGHPLSGPNLHMHPNGQRVCVLCRREHSRAYRRRKAVAA